MALFDFVKDAGQSLARAIGRGRADEEDLARAIEKAGLTIEGLKIALDYDKDLAVVSGRADTLEEKEKAVLIVGNTRGIERVDDRIALPAPRPAPAAAQTAQATAAAPPPSQFHTVKQGDTLWKIAEEAYGDGYGKLHTRIFEANRPMLEDPDKIYPGQVLRIPSLAGQA